MTEDFVVIDTDVVSFLFRGDSRSQFYLPYLLNHRCVISFMTLAELEFGVRRANWSDERRSSLFDWLHAHLVIFNQTTELCSIWAALRVEAERKGRALASSDAWIAATAVLLDVPLLTHNYRDYECLESLNVVSANSASP